MRCLLLFLGLAHAIAARECIWLDWSRDDACLAWELQGQPHRHDVKQRAPTIRRMERLLQQLTDDPASGVQLVPDSRWMSIFREHAFAVSTRHGHPLHPRDERERHSRPFPWQKLAYLRLREYRLLTPAGAYVPTAMPGTADLTLKMKGIDPDRGLGSLQLPKAVGDARLTAKLEQDVHCDHARFSMSPLYRPVSQDLNISRLANVAAYFPNAAAVARLNPNEELPFMHVVHRAKVVWTVVFRGVVGEANLVCKYNTTFEDAVAGGRPKNCEVSLRIRREVAEATGTTGEEGRKALFAAMDSVAYAMQAFRDAGWDGKTPPLPSAEVAAQGAGGAPRPLLLPERPAAQSAGLAAIRAARASAQAWQQAAALRVGWAGSQAAAAARAGEPGGHEQQQPQQEHSEGSAAGGVARLAQW